MNSPCPPRHTSSVVSFNSFSLIVNTWLVLILFTSLHYNDFIFVLSHIRRDSPSNPYVYATVTVSHFSADSQLIRSQLIVKWDERADVARSFYIFIICLEPPSALRPPLASYYILCSLLLPFLISILYVMIKIIVAIYNILSGLWQQNLF